jgi:O-antigen ligase
MQTDTVRAPDTRKTVLLLAVSVAPVIGFVLIRYLGLMALVKLAVVAAVGSAAGLFCFMYPKYGLYFMILYIFGGLNFYLRFGVAAVIPKALMALILAGTLIEALRGKSLRRIDPVFVWSVSILGILALQSMLWARSLDYAVHDFSLFLKSLAVVIMLVQLIRTPRDLETFGRVIFVGTLLTIFLGLMNWKLGVDTHINVLARSVLRFKGAHEDPNIAAGFMTSAIPFGAFFIRRAKTHGGRLLNLFGVAALIVGVFATYSRAALIAFMFVTLCIIFKELRSRKAYVTLAVLAFVGILLTPSYYWQRVWTLAKLAENVRGDWSLYLRKEALLTGWDMFKDHPVLGVGLKNFIVRSDPTMFVRIFTHNLYMEILCGLGLAGLTAYLAVQYAAIRQCTAGMRAPWRKEERWLKDFAYYLMVSLLSALISGLFLSIEFNYLIWVPIGGALALANLRIPGAHGPRSTLSSDPREAS